ncbi:MAG: hypothetical protein JRJ62_00185 [Deltaproteobacteria bacterium]|nr:hypothetical protein [Deltaproteobacteria bacterium]
MKDTISFTVPMEYNALTRVSDMLHGMAIDLQKDGDTSGMVTLEEAEEMVKENCDVTNNSHIGATIPVSQGGTKPDLVEEIEQSASTVFGGEADPKSPAAPVGSATEQVTQTQTTSEVSAQIATVAATNGVELDSNGLPWDHRIHGKARLKLQKTQAWKCIRGIDPALIDKVETELRVTMAASSANPITEVINDLNEIGTTTTNVTNTNVDAEPTIITVTPAKPSTAPVAEQPAPPATDITFPILMGRITAGGITNEAVTAACNKSGITALPLLAARPDLVPAVAVELGITA